MSGPGISHQSSARHSKVGICSSRPIPRQKLWHNDFTLGGDHGRSCPVCSRQRSPGPSSLPVPQARRQIRLRHQPRRVHHAYALERIEFMLRTNIHQHRPEHPLLFPEVTSRLDCSPYHSMLSRFIVHVLDDEAAARAPCCQRLQHATRRPLRIRHHQWAGKWHAIPAPIAHVIDA